MDSKDGDRVQKKMSQALRLQKYAKQYVHESTVRDMYRSTIEPTSSYCCSVWGYCSDTRLNTEQMLQNRAAKIATSSPFDSSPAPLLQTLGCLLVDRLVIQRSVAWYTNPVMDVLPTIYVKSHDYLMFKIGSCEVLNAISLYLQ